MEYSAEYPVRAVNEEHARATLEQQAHDATTQLSERGAAFDDRHERKIANHETRMRSADEALEEHVADGKKQTDMLASRHQRALVDRAVKSHDTIIQQYLDAARVASHTFVSNWQTQRNVFFTET